jgi:hypothetical protein
MATDARLATSLPGHPKTKKLIKRLGQSAAWNLVCLILWAADNRSDGDLSGMSTEDIELSADWLGEDGQFVAALVTVRFLDGQEDAYKLHDWTEHNPWAAGAEARSAKARWNAAKRHHGAAEADRLVPEYAATRSADRNASSTTTAKTEQESSNAPSPSPSPSPSLEIPSLSESAIPTDPVDQEIIPAKPDSKKQPVPACPFDALIDSYESSLPDLPSVTRSLFRDGANGTALKARWSWLMTACHEKGQRKGDRMATTTQDGIDWFTRFFSYAASSEFLTGSSGKFTGCSLGWLVTKANFEKVLGGNYHTDKAA